MMKNCVFIGATMIAVLAASYAGASGCGLINGGFEDDGPISEANFGAQEPNGWTVSIDRNKFRGYVRNDWPTEGVLNLSMYSQWFIPFEAGDMTTVSQQIELENVEKFMFDLKLETMGFGAWDPNVCRAVVLIDADVVWESSGASADVRGEYFDQVYEVESQYRTPGLHELSLGLRINVAESLWERYRVHWDFVDCIAFCGGGGILAGDINRDCYVDMNDLVLLAGAWVEEVDPQAETNVFKGDDAPGYGTIDFFDFAVLADGWVGGFSQVVSMAEKWLQLVDPEDPQNLFHDDDVAPAGIVNFFDYSVLADTWLQSSFIPGQ